MSRKYLVTGAASGIGRATKELLEQRGEQVLGIDIRDADIIADLADDAGRKSMISAATEFCGGVVDGVIAVAGVSSRSPGAVRVNYFGAIATLDGLRPLLANAPAPRAVAVSSMAWIWPEDEELLAACLDGDEDRAVARAAAIAKQAGNDPSAAISSGGGPIYFTSKRALVRWVRNKAPTRDWAGAGIALNAIAPGMVATPMTARTLGNEEARVASEAVIPRPLNGTAEPIAVARLLAWLAGEENSHLCGQVIFIDGGAEALIRGDNC